MSPEEIRRIVSSVIVLVISVTVHEFGHAFVATKLGDDTPRRQGRVTLNPVSHADPIGTLLLPVIGAYYAAHTGVGGGFGWGRPVQTNPNRYTRRFSMTLGQLMVAVAGPMMNILLGLVIAAVHVGLLASGKLAPGHSATQHEIHMVLLSATMLNFTLFFFNLLPAPPLDGGWVLQHFIPYKHRAAFENYLRYGPFIVMAVVMISPLRQIFTVPALWVTEHVYRMFAALFGL